MRCSVILLCLVSIASVACGPREEDARKVLEGNDFEDIELTRDGDGFKFTAKQGNQICEGTISASGTTHSYSSQCERDTSACKKGKSEACMTIADELYAKEEKVFPTLAAELYRTACEDDVPKACRRAAEFERIDKKWDKVREFSKKACDLDDGPACSILATTEDEGQGTEADKKKALELYKKACDKKHPRGCRAAAGLLIDGAGGEKDPAAAIPYAEKGCEAKWDDSCLVLGVALFRTEKDYPRALTLLAGACDTVKSANRAIACNLAGAIHADGKGTAADPKAAFPYFEKACEAKSSDGCINAGDAYKNGRGAPRDAAKAKELYAKACSLGRQDYCDK